MVIKKGQVAPLFVEYLIVIGVTAARPHSSVADHIMTSVELLPDKVSVPFGWMTVTAGAVESIVKRALSPVPTL